MTGRLSQSVITAIQGMNSGFNDTPKTNQPTAHMIFRKNHRFTQMKDMQVTPHLDHAPYVFFEPKPSESSVDDGTLEGCLRHAVKVEQMSDKQNLYWCEQCTEDKFGKSKFLANFYPLSQNRRKST